MSDIVERVALALSNFDNRKFDLPEIASAADFRNESDYTDYMDLARAAIAAMQADAEPVAWLYVKEGFGRELRIHRADNLVELGWAETPLYAHPPVRNTDDQALLQEARDELSAIMARLDPGDGNAPGHGHKIPGIWDDDNSRELAGQPCHWCARWNQGRAFLTKLDAALGERP